MRILALTPHLPWPPQSGASMRNGAILADLAARHEVTLATFGDRQAAAAPAYRDRFAQVVVAPPPPPRRLARWPSLFARRPDLIDRLASPHLLALLARVGREQPIDGVLVEGLEMSRYVEPLAAGAGHPILVYDAHNVEWRLQAQSALVHARSPAGWPIAAYASVQARRLRTVEGAWLTRADAVTCTSDVDASSIRALAPDQAPVVIPNVVSLPERAQLAPLPGTPTMLFAGTMDYRPNIDALWWMIRSVLPRMRITLPDVHLTVVGRNPPAALTRTERRVRFTGQVDDLRPHLAEAAVCVAPLRIGSGTRLKVLEALAHLRPVVSTSVGVEGLRLRHEHDLLIADSAEAFARAAIRLLTNRGEAELLAARGRASVEAHYSPRAIAGAMAAVFDRAAAVRSSRQ